jgi:hypothetical protein
MIATKVSCYCTVQYSMKVRKYFRTFESTFVRKYESSYLSTVPSYNYNYCTSYEDRYESTFVLRRYFRTTLYTYSTEVRKYFRKTSKVRKYFRS